MGEPTCLTPRAEAYRGALVAASDPALRESAPIEPLVVDVADYPRSSYSIREVRRAGEAIAGDLVWTDESAPAIREAFRIANNWRDAHAYPMRSIRHSLIWHMRKNGLDGITAARLKRMQAIRRKLRRVRWNLNQLQDLGGCRVILPNISDVRSLAQIVQDDVRHDVHAHDDYVQHPKDDGYRSRHLILKFDGRSDASIYNGRRIEVQIRTRLQHSWATAVEAVGLFRGEELKNHQGSDDWLRLFVLMSGEFAEAEGCVIPRTCPEQEERRRELGRLATSLDAVNMLETINHGVRGADLPLGYGYKPTHYLIRYDHDTKMVYVEPKSIPAEATRSYDEAEEKGNESGIESQNIVLVEVDKVENLKRAYPNYFGDVALFLHHLQNVIVGRRIVEYSVPPRQPPPNPAGERGDLSWLRRSRFRSPSLKKKS